MNDNTILFHITEDQARVICDHYKLDYTKLEDYEICTLLDNLIDEFNNN